MEKRELKKKIMKMNKKIQKDDELKNIKAKRN